MKVKYYIKNIVSNNFIDWYVNDYREEVLSWIYNMKYKTKEEAFNMIEGIMELEDNKYFTIIEIYEND